MTPESTKPTRRARPRLNAEEKALRAECAERDAIAAQDKARLASRQKAQQREAAKRGRTHRPFSGLLAMMIEAGFFGKGPSR